MDLEVGPQLLSVDFEGPMLIYPSWACAPVDLSQASKRLPTQLLLNKFFLKQWAKASFANLVGSSHGPTLVARHPCSSDELLPMCGKPIASRGCS